MFEEEVDAELALLLEKKNNLSSMLQEKPIKHLILSECDLVFDTNTWFSGLSGIRKIVANRMASTVYVPIGGKYLLKV